MSTYRKLKHLESIVTKTRKYSIVSSRKGGASFGQVVAVNLKTMKEETLYVLHNSIIATKANNIVTLNFDGWKTPLTRKYMEKALQIENIKASIYSNYGVPCIRLVDEHYCFITDKCRINTKAHTINLPTYETYMNARNKINKW